MRFFGRRLALVLALMFTVMTVPGTVAADTISVSQVIVITARVMPARSIVVNQQGQMIKIYSNTNENVAPKVYEGDVPGPERPLTPVLLAQYQKVLSQQTKLNGVAIDVPLPVTERPVPEIGKLLSKTLSVIRWHFSPL